MVEQVDVVAETFYAVGFFRIRRIIRAAPDSIAHDIRLKGLNALNFAATKTYLSLSAAALVTGLFAVTFGESLWSLQLDDAVSNLTENFRDVLTGIFVPLSALISAGIVIRFGISRRSRGTLDLHELRRRYFLSEGSVGLWAAILLATFYALSHAITGLMDSGQLNIWRNLGLESHDSLGWLFAGCFLAVLIWNVAAFVKACRRFFINTSDDRTRSAFSRLILVSIAARLGIFVLLYFVAFGVSLVAAKAAYLSALFVRDELGVESVVPMSVAKAEILGGQSLTEPSKVENSNAFRKVSLKVMFSRGSFSIDDQGMAQLEQVAHDWKNAWQERGISVDKAGSFLLIAASNSDEDLSSQEHLAQRRATAIEYALVKGGALPGQFSTIENDLGRAVPVGISCIDKCVSVTYYLPSEKD